MLHIKQSELDWWYLHAVKINLWLKQNDATDNRFTSSVNIGTYEILTSSVDPDEMSQHVAFYQGLHNIKQSSGKKT